jgi:hypothetical protein
MRKFSLILAVLLLAAPAWARVDVTMEKTDTNEVTVSYNVTGEPNKVRAFALDITLDNDVNITDVNDSVSDYYTIFPGSVVISGGEITNEGTAVADPCDYPADSQPGLGSSGITIEMGALYSPPTDDSPNSPPNQGVLLKFYFETGVDCNACITQNEARGGVVLTDPDEDIADFNSPCIVLGEPECLIGGNAGPLEKSDWDAWDKPDCWCYQRQCRGDINGQKLGPYWVQMADLATFKAAYLKIDTILATIPNGICADLNHKKLGPYRVQMADLTIFKTYYLKLEHQVPVCDQAPVITGPYNFWTN